MVLRLLLRLIIVSLLICIVGMVALWWSLQPAPNHNALAEVGSAQELSIPLQAPQELDGLTRQEIFDLRSAEVMRFPQLLAAPYTPADAVFGAIVDGLPWWGTIGQFYYANGELSITGEAEESRFILNPYLLVWAEFLGMSIYGDGDWAWDEARVEAEKLKNWEHPLYCEPQDLRWQARQGSVRYDVTTCLENINRWRVRPLTPENWWFDLAAYNARDLNLNYIYVVYAESDGISKDDAPTEALKIPHYIHQGGSCGYPGGCNNMSPSFPPTEVLYFERLPAEVVIWLWQERPSQPPSQPDFVWRIILE